MNSLSLINAIPVFLLILARLTSFLVTMPIFSYRTIPAPVKIGLAAVLALLVDVTLFENQAVPLDGRFVLLILKEVLVGLTMGFVAGIITYAVQLAGAFIDMQMGFAIANVISPESGVPTPLTGQFLYVLQLLFFLGVNAHHMLINGILSSFQLIPLNSLGIAFNSGNTAEFVAQITAQMFLIAAQLAMPIVGCLFLVDIAVGLVARTVPQVNVFVVGLPLKVLAGFAVMLVVFPSLIGLFRIIFESMTSIFNNFMHLLGS
ncbi:MAG: flagellar type secretion system protein FliR [Sporolactobacillus laevolacticus]|jgi:flagellar biosynthetic protein FliR|uniref:Flagellar biosynthetic protein FliR n=1 Tax=Sporolactobacillus laevolacticus DSM 442 TaxID=1395513 RepID=V6IZW6_9BACL|nr:flagellar biosynthetic protein FliR [Sporolactobacillus laevolacticus]EST13060.1 flagellar biosynthesis protein FliR [Sporolactobacillus laevolacticus DSM 442]MDF2911271.1 flagellar type secretion system protein FliR [Sporolactobacillus laevolacticus]